MKQKTVFSRLNKKQREKTADLLLEITKALILAVAIGVLFPDISKQIGPPEILIALLLALIIYFFAMKLYKEKK